MVLARDDLRRYAEQQQNQHDLVGPNFVKLPAFWIDKPTIWFAQVEAQFALADITAKLTKYNHENFAIGRPCGS